MDDNPNLTSDFVESQKRLYTGFFYKRFIEGLWVLAEGAIYKDSLLEEEKIAIDLVAGRGEQTRPSAQVVTFQQSEFLAWAAGTTFDPAEVGASVFPNNKNLDTAGCLLRQSAEVILGAIEPQ